MAKELPYFQFEPAEYLTKDISFCSLSAQGLFINICSYYWQRECKLTKEQFLKRLNNELEFNELLNEGVFSVDDEGFISIKFLDLQYAKATNKSVTNSENGSKGGRPKKAKINPNETEIKANQNPIKSESKGIREENIKEDKIKEENIIDSSKLLSVYNSILGKTARVVNTKTKTQIKDRLKEGYTKEDIVNAIRNASKDPHHIEFNYKYLTLEFITRPDKLDRFVNMGDFKIKTQIL
jgi:uncharacterized phage protein (TIGR02220 family)